MSKCRYCPRRPEDPCSGELNPEVCKIAEKRHRAGVPTYRDDGTSVDNKTIARIEACDFRVSSCGCLGKPANCYQASHPVSVILSECVSCVGSHQFARVPSTPAGLNIPDDDGAGTDTGTSTTCTGVGRHASKPAVTVEPTNAAAIYLNIWTCHANEAGSLVIGGTQFL